MCASKQCRHCENIAINYTYKIFNNMLKIFKTILRTMWIYIVLFILIMVYKWTNDPSISVTLISKYPVIVWWTNGFPGTSEIIHCPEEIKCEVYSDRNISQYDVEAYLFYGSNIDFTNLPLPRRPDNVLWGLYHEESPRNKEEFLHEQILTLFNYSSTYSRYSTVPFPLQYLESFADITSRKYFVETQNKNVLLEKEISPVLYLQSDCETSTERDAYVEELMKYIKVDSYGDCLKNKQLPSKFKDDYLNNLNENEFLKFIARYKFVVAIENGVCDDYVTEKFWRAIKVGSVPIYFGSPSIKHWYPNSKSAILLQDFPTPEILSKHLYKLLEHDDLYEEYLEHKIKQHITNDRLLKEYQMRNYQMDGFESVRKFECFVCKQLFSKREGTLGENIVSKAHYNCPKPISALTLGVNPLNNWIYSWEKAKESAVMIYKNVIES